MREAIIGGIAAIIGAVALVLLGYETGVDLTEAKYTKAKLELVEQFDKERKEYRTLIDTKGAEHAEALDRKNKELADTRVKLAGLATGRPCLSLPAVRLLNDIGGVPTPAGAAASQPSGTPEAFATDRDVGDALAICRSEHSKLADQLNKILDIEDARLNLR